MVILRHVLPARVFISSTLHQSVATVVTLKRWLCSSVAPLGLLALFATGAAAPVWHRARQQAGQKPESLGPVVVSPPERKPVRRTAVRAQRSRAAGRAAGRARTQTVVPAPAPASGGGEVAHSPLNTNAVAESASRLGLTVREIPATVEVIDQRTIREQGYRTVSEVAQGAVGVTSGDYPAEPSAFSMRGFTNSQINTLYNGIKIGPQNMTSRVMDTANLESVEFLKGPASLMSGEGAAGGAINYVTKQPTTGPIRNEAFFSWIR